MAQKEGELTPQFIAQEMREAVLFSFPLSPGILTGHNATLLLYWHFRRDYLSKTTVHSVFGTDKPKPIRLVIPKGHLAGITSPEGFNQSIMDDMVNFAFRTRPQVNWQRECQNIISGVVGKDVEHFEARLRGEMSRFKSNVSPAPSHLRSFLYEGGFPGQNQFTDWLFIHMRTVLEVANRRGFSESWSYRMPELLSQWNYYMSEPFFPELK